MTAAFVAVIILFVVIAVFYYTVDPTSDHMPRCTFHLLTGYECPGCGFQRALHSMLHGRVAEAWHYNPFAFFALPVATFYIAIEALRNRYPRIHTYAVHPFAIVLIAIAILAFWILRNL